MWNIDAFIESLERERLSEHTIAWYRQYLSKFVSWCESASISSPRQVTESTISRYIAGPVRDAHYRAGTKKLIVIALRRYFASLEATREVFYSPATHLSVPRTEVSHFQSIKLETLRTVLDSFPTDHDEDVLVLSILETAYSSALRTSELRRLQIEDVDFTGMTLNINQSKGDKDRTVPIGKTALFWIRRYLSDVRPRYLNDAPERTIYISLHSGAAFKQIGFRQLIARRLSAHGLPHIGIHQLRASAATHLVQAGANIAHVQRILGHSEIDTTRDYVHFDHHELAAVLSESHPRGSFERSRR